MLISYSRSASSSRRAVPANREPGNQDLKALFLRSPWRRIEAPLRLRPAAQLSWGVTNTSVVVMRSGQVGRRMSGRLRTVINDLEFLRKKC
jgi:hypothetical protein